MNGALLHVVRRELRLAARRPGFHGKRCLSVIGLAGLAVWSVAAPQSALPLAARAHFGFMVVAAILAVFCALAGLRHAANWLSEERLNGTVVFLRQANVTATEVVLGNFAAKFLQALYEVLPIFPVLLLTITMGGTSLLEIGRMILVLLVILYLSLAIGVTSATFCRGEREAAIATVCLLFAVGIGLPLAEKMGAAFLPLSGQSWWMTANPVATFQMAEQSAFQTNSPAFFHSLALHCLLGSAALILGCRSLGRRFAGESAGFHRPHWLSALLLPWREGGVGGPSLASPAGEFLQPTARLLAARPGMKHLLPISFGPLAAVVVVCIAFRSGNRPACELSLAALYAAHLCVKTVLGLEACFRLQAEGRAGTLMLELSTPVTAEEVIRRHYQDIRRNYRWPMWLGLLANLCTLALVCLLDHPPLNIEEKTILAACLVLGSIAVSLDWRALCWVGLWSGLKSRRAGVALLHTIAVVILAPWAGVWVLATCNVGNLFTENDVAAYFLCWIILGLAMSFIGAAVARHRLATHLRARALP